MFNPAHFFSQKAAAHENHASKLPLLKRGMTPALAWPKHEHASANAAMSAAGSPPRCAGCTPPAWIISR
jgi:hypothetical protein